MKTASRGCALGRIFQRRRRKIREDRPTPRPVRNKGTKMGRGCSDFS